MSKKRKKSVEEGLARFVPHEDLVRKSIAKGLIRDGSMLDIYARGFHQYRVLDDCRALGSKEHQYLEEAERCIRRAQKIALIIGRRNQRG